MRQQPRTGAGSGVGAGAREVVGPSRDSPPPPAAPRYQLQPRYSDPDELDADRRAWHKNKFFRRVSPNDGSLAPVKLVKVGTSLGPKPQALNLHPKNQKPTPYTSNPTPPASNLQP